MLFCQLTTLMMLRLIMSVSYNILSELDELNRRGNTEAAVHRCSSKQLL